MIKRADPGSIHIILWRLIFIVLIGFVTGCENVAVTPGPVMTEVLTIDVYHLPPRGFFLGFLPNPSEGQSFADAYQQAAQIAEFAPIWGRPTPFYQFADDLSGDWGRIFVEEYLIANNMFPLVHLSFIDAGLTLKTPPGMSDVTLNDPDWRSAYVQAALDVVQVASPRYLSIGNEVNRWFEKYGAEEDNDNGFQHYVSLYEEIYAAVKQISPDTFVFCTFAREIVSQNQEADMSVINLFNPQTLDLLVITSYPHSVASINRPTDIPTDYYARLSGFLHGKPFGFSEVAWHALDAFGGEEAQAEFLRLITGLLTRDTGMELRLLGWPWLVDLDENDSMGLIRRDGSPKIVLEVWEEIAVRDR